MRPVDKVYTVTFLPDNVTVNAAEGTNLLLAARTAGIDMQSPCGGRGTCGKCAVRIISGRYEAGTDSHMPEELCREGYVPACRTSVQEDMVVEIPPFSRLTRHKVLLENKGFRSGSNISFLSDSLRPLCRKLQVRVSPPDLSDMTNDLDRVKTCLSREFGVSNVKISLSCLRKLPALLREGEWEVTLTIVELGNEVEILGIEPGTSTKPAWGLAVDIGTTTVAISLVNLDTGNIADSEGTYNKQSVYGSDVISRIIHTDERQNGLRDLQEAVIDTVNGLMAEVLERQGLCKNDIAVVVCAGNTVMSHLFLAVPPTYLRLEPYVPAAVSFPSVRAKDLGLAVNQDAIVLTLPAVASYVGGDITAGVLATGISRSDKLTLFIDIGTNGELVLGNGEWLVTCACSAGPAFEGSGISCGMRAMTGAIDRVEIDPVTLAARCRTIGDTRPVGICGSGLIQLLAELKKAGITDRAGKILENRNASCIRRGNEGTEYVLVTAERSGSGQDIVVTEGDLKNLLRAKGAIFAGIRTMLQMVQLDIKDIDRVYIAGGFGNCLNIADAVNIGLLPDLPAEKYEYVGNSSLQGAVAVLLSKDELAGIDGIAARMTYLELSVGNLFMEEFVSALFIPHTDLELFPSVGK
jgi:uncharacterized 2Fe-2S/4Fe-4S cluster protein (DUF4445 family)